MNWRPIETVDLENRVLIVDTMKFVFVPSAPLKEILQGRPVSDFVHKFGWTHWMPLPEPPEAE